MREPSDGGDATHPTARTAPAELSRRYELLHEFSRDIVLFLDRAGTILDANVAAVGAYGYPREQLLGMDVRKLRTEATRGLVDAQIETSLRTDVLFETVHQRKDGTSFPVEVHARS